MLKKKAEEDKKTHYHSLYKNEERREQLQLILARFFLLHFLTKNKLITKHRSNTIYTNGSFLFFACLFSAGAYIHYTDHMYMRETIIIHVMWAAHSWTDEPIYKHIYSTRHLIHSPDDDEKLHFKDPISFFLAFLLYDVDLSLMNWTS